jgi:hypothetical protein
MVLLGALVFASLATAPAPSARVGIFDLGVVGLDQGARQTAIDALATAVAAQPGISVVSRSDLDALLGVEKLKDLIGCNNVSCLVDAGLAAGVDTIISGSVSKLDRTLIVSLQLVDVVHATAANRVTMSWPGSTGALPDLLAAAADLLLGAADRKVGGARLLGLRPGSTIVVDGEPKAADTTTLTNLDVGVHQLHVEAVGFLPYDEPFLVRANRSTSVDIRLQSTASDSREPLGSWFVHAGGGPNKTLRAVQGTTAQGTGGLLGVEAGHVFDSGVALLGAFTFHGTNMQQSQSDNVPIEHVGGGLGVGYRLGDFAYVMPSVLFEVLQAKGKKLNEPNAVPAWVEDDAGVSLEGSIVPALVPGIEAGYAFTPHAFAGVQLLAPLVFYPKSNAWSAALCAFVGGAFG